jgi:hypothetical protein
MNDLRKYFDNNKRRKIVKSDHYFDIYDRHFSKYRNQQINVIEFGVARGGSLQMWKEYFGPQANIYGIDIKPECKEFEEDRIKIFIGDQEDKSFLSNLTRIISKADIVIDDGGHYMQQQINTFEVMYPHVSDNGVYLVEDLHTSYWNYYGGGYKKGDTFIEYSKNFIDDINAWMPEDTRHFISDITRSAYSLHFYTSMLVIEKAIQHKWTETITGED